MKVKIIKAGKPIYWYSDKVGMIYDVKEDAIFSSYECTGEPNGTNPNCIRCIDVDDCVVIDDNYDRQMTHVSYLDLLEQIENSYLGKLTDREKNIVNRVRDLMLRGM